MSNGSKFLSRQDNANSAVAFGDHFQQSNQFEAIFKEGMALVEETAAYLDGQGRRESKKLNGTASVTYATESMRLTTRLLELASWLLIRRAVRDGDIGAEEASRRRAKVKLGTTGRPSHIKDWDALPDTLRNLIEASFAMQDRILQLDRAFEFANDEIAAESTVNPVAVQLARIENAFGQRIRTTELN